MNPDLVHRLSLQLPDVNQRPPVPKKAANPQRGRSFLNLLFFPHEWHVFNSRGLGDLAKHLYIAECNSEYNLDFLAISETGET